MRASHFLLAALLCLLSVSPGVSQQHLDRRTSLEKRTELRAWYYSHLNVREIGKTNRGPEIDQWQLAAGKYALGTFWCAWFVSAGLKACTIGAPYFGRARSFFDPAHIILNHGRPVAGAPPPQFGDLVGYEWGAKNVSHVGFNDIWGSTSMCQTVEGNTGGGKLSRDGDGVFKNWRLKSQVAYVANVVDRPHYTHGE